MAEIAARYLVSRVANRLSKFLVKETLVVSQVRDCAAWIEKELRLMEAFIVDVEQGGYTYNEEEGLNVLAEELKDIARDANDVLNSFKSDKRRKKGVMQYLLDKYDVGQELERIRERMMTGITKKRMNYEQTNISVSVTVETPGQASSSSSVTPTTIAAPAVEKLDHVLSQNLTTRDKVIEIVEEVRDKLGDLQNIVSNLMKSTSEREKVWMEEVKDVCNHTADVAGNFIAKSEKWLEMGRLRKLLHCLLEGRKFEKQMEDMSTQIGDALYRWLTFGFGVGGEDRMGSRSRPDPSLSLRRLIVVKVPFLAVNYVFLPLLGLWFLALILDFLVFGGSTTEERKPEPKKRETSRMMWLKTLSYFDLFDFLIFVLFYVLPLEVVAVFQLCSILCTVGVWIVSLWRSMDENLKSTARYLALMRAFLSDTDGAEGQNERQKVWGDQLRVVAQNGQSLIAAAYAKSKGGWFPTMGRIKFAHDIDHMLSEILNISDRKTTYVIANIEGRKEFAPSSSGPRMQESEITVEHHNNSGADTEEHPLVSASSSYRPVRGLKQRVQSIRGEMQLMDALLRDAQEIGELDGRSKIWVEQMRGIAGETQSFIDEYAPIVEHRHSLSILCIRPVIIAKINGIRDKTEDASRRRKTYGLVQLQSRAESLSMVQVLRRRTQPSLVAKESSVVGFDDDAEVLMGQLLSDEKRRCITCIVGIGGTGKTTLARLIFDDNVVKEHFECRVWVSVPSNCMPHLLLEEITKEAAKQIMGMGGLKYKWTAAQESSTHHHHHHRVLETLASTRYLIVVDGIETSQVLDTLTETIPDRSTACRLLLTTRNVNVTLLHHHAAAATGTPRTFVHPLQLLDDENSWILFDRNLKVAIPPEQRVLKEVAEKIVTKCGGLPSEILKMSELASNLHRKEWKSVLRDQTPWSETLGTINMNLPSYLTRCLFYFVLFPAEFGIPARRLVVLWVAESLVNHHAADGVPPEQVAERYLTELIDRNMVQIAKRKRNGKVKTCRLPNALRPLWLTKAIDSRFLHGHTHSTATEPKSNSIIRQVADRLDQNDIWHKHIHGDTDATATGAASASLGAYYKDVLSFLSFDTREGSKPGQQIGNFLNLCIGSDCFLVLRVLDLEGVYKPRLPTNIARLSRLRYLGLRRTYLESLPSSISSLLKLQTLDLKHTYINTLTPSIWKMQLRHLFLSETYRTRFPPKPKKGHADSLSDLQTLWGLFVDEETPVKGGLDKLVNVKKLGLACQSMSMQRGAMIAQLEAVADWIMKLEYLQSLRLKSRNEQGHPWYLLLKSLENHTNLTDIHLLGCLTSSYVLSQFPLSLGELTLSHSELHDDPMQILKDFPNLRTLCLHAESYVGTSMVCESQSFPQLHVLKLWLLEQLEEWDIEEGALPCLRQLEIRSCRRLKVLPDGLKHVDTLLELILTNMPKEIFTAADTHKIPSGCRVLPVNLQ